MKNKSVILLTLLCLPLVSGCDDPSIKEAKTGFNYFYNDEATGHISNPGMGWVGIEETIFYGQVEAGGSGTIPEVDIISIESSWEFLEPEKDKFDFSLIDKTIEYWKQHNKKINFRIMTDALSLGFIWKGAPDWLLNDPRCGYEVISFDVSHPGRVNDEYKVARIDSPYYKERLAIFLGKLAERYGDDKTVESVEIRGYGNWGEWHSGASFNTMADRLQALQDVVDIYHDAYAKHGKMLIVSNSYDPTLLNYYNGNFNSYVNSSALDYVFKKENSTYRRDAVGSSIFKDEYEGKLIFDLVRSGKKVPQYSEFYWSANDMANASNDGWNFENAVNHMLFKGRPNASSVIGYNPYAVADMVDNNQTWALDRGNERLGYRFVLEQARVNKEVAPGKELSVMIKLSNKGVGRFYFNDKLKYYICDSNGNVVYEQLDNQNDIRNIMSGDVNEYYQQIKLPKDLKNGTYTVKLAIVDENQQPHVSLAIKESKDKIYEIATFDVKSNAKSSKVPEVKLTLDELKNYTLDANSIYTLTFGYTPKFDIKNYEFRNFDGYAVKLKSKKGGTNKTLLKFQDVSQEYGSKTVTFETYGKNDYLLDIVSENFGDIEIHDIYLRKESGKTINFDNTLSKDIVAVDNNAEEVNDVIHGKSLSISSNSLGDLNGASLEKIKLEPNSRYTISFNTKTNKDVGIGGYYYAKLVNENGGKDVYQWYERPDDPYTYKSFTVTTSNSNNNVLYFGCHNRGSYTIDDITIVKEIDGVINKTYDYGFKHNQRPQFTDRMSETETFEKISFLQSNMQWGYYRWGRMTRNPSKVISGNQSFWGIIDEQKLTDYMELMYSNPNFVRFEKGKTYKIEFDYRVYKNPVNPNTNEAGYFYVLCRSDKLGLNGDVGWNVFTDNEIGKTKHYSVLVTIGNSDDYKFIFGQYQYGEIVIDNLKIKKFG